MYRRPHWRLPTRRRYRQPNYSVGEGYVPPPGKNAPAEVQHMWNEAFQAAHRYYESQRSPDPKVIASNTAWKTVTLFWKKGFGDKFTRKNPNGGLAVGWTRDGNLVHIGDTSEPTPKPTAEPRLAKFIEIAFIDQHGVLRAQHWNEPGLPNLMWDDEGKILTVFPTAEIRSELDHDLRGLEPQVKMFKRWAKGRKPTAKVRVRTPIVNVAPVGVADTIVYRSDKFSGKHNPHPDLKGSQEYVHQFDDGVFVEEPRGRPPKAIVIQGGKLDVIPGGIVH